MRSCAKPEIAYEGAPFGGGRYSRTFPHIWRTCVRTVGAAEGGLDAYFRGFVMLPGTFTGCGFGRFGWSGDGEP